MHLASPGTHSRGFLLIKGGPAARTPSAAADRRLNAAAAARVMINRDDYQSE